LGFEFPKASQVHRSNGNGQSRGDKNSQHSGDSQHPEYLEWSNHVLDFGQEGIELVMQWRVWSHDFCEWLNLKRQEIGLKDDCIVFPIRDPLGRVIRVHCRIGVDTEGKAEWRYFPSKMGNDRLPGNYPLFLLPDAEHTSDKPLEAIVTESQWDGYTWLDRLELWRTGGWCLACTRGASGQLPQQVLDLKPSTVRLLAQNDDANGKWLKNVLGQIDWKANIFIVRPPAPDKDLNDWVRRSNPDAAAMTALLESAERYKPTVPDYGVRYLQSPMSYWKRDEDSGEWTRVDKEMVKSHLALHYGLKKNKPAKKDCTADEIDKALDVIVHKHKIQAAGCFAGYLEAGVQTIGKNKKILIPQSLILPDICEGSFPTILRFISGLLPNLRQRLALLGMLQWALRSLRYSEPGKWKPKKALILLGEAGCGKGSLEALINLCLTGRRIDATQYLTGDSSFNGQFGTSELWTSADPAVHRLENKRNLVKMIKNLMANSILAVNTKMVTPEDLALYKFLIISVNDDTFTSVFTTMEPSTLDKMMFLSCVYNERSCPTGENWEKWLETVEGEIPGFLHWLLNVFRVPKSLYDARWGVKYKNRRVEAILAAPTPDEKEQEKDEVFSELILKGCLVMKLTPNQILEKLADNLRAKRAGIPQTNNWLGRMLNEWVTSNEGCRSTFRVSLAGKTDSGAQVYRFRVLRPDEEQAEG
jgi:hypothetical protein